MPIGDTNNIAYIHTYTESQTDTACIHTYSDATIILNTLSWRSCLPCACRDCGNVSQTCVCGPSLQQMHRQHIPATCFCQTTHNPVHGHICTQAYVQTRACSLILVCAQRKHVCMYAQGSTYSRGFRSPAGIPRMCVKKAWRSAYLRGCIFACVYVIYTCSGERETLPQNHTCMYSHCTYIHVYIYALYAHEHMNVRQSSAKMVHQTIHVCTYMHTSVSICIHMCIHMCNFNR